MERPLLRAFNRYQLFWASIWRDLAKYVLMMGEKYAPNFSIDEEYDVDINMNSVIDVSIDDVSKSATSLVDLYDRSLISEPVAAEISEQLMRVIMQTIGIDDIEGIFEVEEEEMPEEPEDEEPDETIPPPVPPGEEEPPDNEVEEAAKRFVRLLNIRKRQHGK